MSEIFNSEWSDIFPSSMVSGAPSIALPDSSTYSTNFVVGTWPFEVASCISFSSFSTSMLSGICSSVSVSDVNCSEVCSVSVCCASVSLVNASVSCVSSCSVTTDVSSSDALTVSRFIKQIEKIRSQEHAIFKYVFQFLCLIFRIFLPVLLLLHE